MEKKYGFAVSMDGRSRVRIRAWGYCKRDAAMDAALGEFERIVQAARERLDVIALVEEMRGYETPVLDAWARAFAAAAHVVATLYVVGTVNPFVSRGISLVALASRVRLASVATLPDLDALSAASE